MMSKDYFQHELAVIETEKVGQDIRIWVFAHILPSAKVGTICNYRKVVR
jgi:UDP-2-acetamido-3-amino-2,3-dideoxy-glucuronate N-acetyltransferase